MFYSQHLFERLSARIVGQDLAIREMVRTLTVARSGIRTRPGPVAAYLFLGPTGTGKTALAAAAARELYGDEGRLIHLPLAPIENSAQLVEQLGFHIERVGALVSSEDANEMGTTRRCEAVIVIDDLAEASGEVLSLIYHLLDHGRMELGGGEALDVGPAVFVFKCRHSSSHLNELNRQGPIGFAASGDPDEDDELDQRIYETARKLIETAYPAEFVGRLDRMVVFRRFRKEHLPGLLDRALAETVSAVKMRGFESLEVHIDQDLRGLLLAKAERRLHLGARPMWRNVRKYVAFPLADLAVSGNLGRCVHVELGLRDGQPVATCTARAAIGPPSQDVKLLPTHRGRKGAA
jgi:ATP-dependent Clp protease ATP-binding subunit ClpA